MNRIDLSPLYRSSVGFDRFGSLLDTAMRNESSTGGYPPYNIEVVGENEYSVTLALAGFDESDLNIQVEKGVLTIRGEQAGMEDSGEYLYKGIANRTFERKFNLADHVEVKGAALDKGLLVISLVKEVPEALKPRNIVINGKIALVDANAA
ncbi:MAG: molecular chaperone IbpA [Pseudomonadales bacterium]|jgi:molecular chaperone IbpA